jgi:hypothetical protein
VFSFTDGNVAGAERRFYIRLCVGIFRVPKCSAKHKLKVVGSLYFASCQYNITPTVHGFQTKSSGLSVKLGYVRIA